MRQVILLFLVAALLPACSTAPKSKTSAKPKTTFSSFDPIGVDPRVYGPDEINLKQMDIEMFLALYQQVSGRTVIRPAHLTTSGITFRNQQSVTRIRVLQLFDTALAAKGIAMVLVGEDAVKAVPEAQATREPGPVINLPADQLPESSSYMVRTVPLKRVKAVELMPSLQPLAGLHNSIVASNDPNLLILRDYSANIRAMLKLIEEVESGRKR